MRFAIYALFGLSIVAPSYGKELSLSLQTQQQSQWCWAAVTQAVVGHNQNRTLSQCQMASRFNHSHPGHYCCSAAHSSSHRCNRGLKIYRSLDAYGALDRHLFAPISTHTLREEIDRGFPVAIRIQWKSGKAHYLLAYGVQDQWISIWDPARTGGRKVVNRSELVNYKGGKWVETFLTK